MSKLKFITLAILLTIYSAGFSTDKKQKTNNKKKNKTEMQKEKQIKYTASGLEYIIHEKGEGPKANAGDMVTVHYRGMFPENGEVFDNSFERGKPIKFILGEGQVIKGWDEFIQLLNVGDSATVVIPPQLGYGDKATGPIPANSRLKFDVKLIDAKQLKAPAPYDTTGITPITTDSGLKVYIIEKGNGKMAAEVTKALIDYSGYLEDGTLFDSSYLRDEPLYIPVGVGMVIRGWDEGLKLIDEGSKVRFVIPASIGYGDQDLGVIPPNSTLIFDIHVLEFKNPDKK